MGAHPCRGLAWQTRARTHVSRGLPGGSNSAGEASAPRLFVEDSVVATMSSGFARRWRIPLPIRRPFADSNPSFEAPKTEVCAGSAGTIVRSPIRVSAMPLTDTRPAMGPAAMMLRTSRNRPAPPGEPSPHGWSRRPGPGHGASRAGRRGRGTGDRGPGTGDRGPGCHRRSRRDGLRPQSSDRTIPAAIAVDLPVRFPTGWLHDQRLGLQRIPRPRSRCARGRPSRATGGAPRCRGTRAAAARRRRSRWNTSATLPRPAGHGGIHQPLRRPTAEGLAERVRQRGGSGLPSSSWRGSGDGIVRMSPVIG